MNLIIIILLILLLGGYGSGIYMGYGNNGSIHLILVVIVAVVLFGVVR